MVTERFAEDVSSYDPGTSKIYACGPRPMFKQLSELLAENPVSCQILMEERMACGVGACLGCTVPLNDVEGIGAHARACIDGPVFNIRDIQMGLIFHRPQGHKRTRQESMKNVRPEMQVDIGGLIIKNPVMTASGTFGYGKEYAPYLDIRRLGAIITKGISLEPRAGNKPPRIMETPCGMLNAIGLENPGVHAFIKEKLPFLREFDVPVIANVFGETIEEFKKVTELLSEAKGVKGLEINISCPNVKKGGIIFGSDPDMAHAVTKEVKRLTDLPVIIKLTPNVTDICLIAESVEEGGADAISLINTLTGMSVDIERRIPHLANVTGGLSGPAIKPIALRMVWQVAKRVKIPVIGIGGIANAGDALEFLIVGARAVQVGTANFINPCATMDIIDGIEEYLKRHNMADVNDLIGTFDEEGKTC